MIPHEAIKAATKAFIEHGTLIPALEAAAPYMQADAWDEGWDKAMKYEYAPNPYRLNQWAT